MTPFPVMMVTGPVTLPGDTVNQIILMKLRGSDGAVCLL